MPVLELFFRAGLLAVCDYEGLSLLFEFAAVEAEVEELLTLVGFRVMVELGGHISDVGLCDEAGVGCQISFEVFELLANLKTGV
jgi:hypothetical protein